MPGPAERTTTGDTIPTFVRTMSLNDMAEDNSGRDGSNVSIESPSARKAAKSSSRQGQEEQQPNESEWGLPSSPQSTFEDIIPSIMSALSLSDMGDKMVGKDVEDDSAASRPSRPIDSIETPAERNTVDSGHREVRKLQEDYDNYKSFNNNNSNSDSDSDNAGVQLPQHLQIDAVDIPLTSKAVESSTRRRGRQQRKSQSNDEEKSRATDTKEEGTFLDSYGFPAMMDEAANSQMFRSIRNVLSLDNDGAGETRDTAVVENGASQVYPFVRNVFSMNGYDRNVAQDSKEKVSEIGKINGQSVSPSRRDEETGNSPQQRKRKPRQSIVVTRAYEVKEHYLESVFYVSISAILGSVFRVYMARLFGLDCQYTRFNDFLIPLASNICVTNDGRSEQTGGALFTDFPSNVFGSFLMGVITPPADNQRARLPWLHRDHPLQRDEVFHASLGTGFCGCLTTFASWNTQMVVMLDGTYCELGSQVVTVFFGYLIGFMGASYGFHLGRHCGLWMYNFRHRNEDEMLSQSESGGMNEIRITESQGSTTNDVALVDEGVELVDDDNVALQPVPSHLHKIPLFLTAVALLVAFVIGDIRNGIEFYKGMTLLWLLSPVGSLLRWRLSNLNRKNRGMVITISPDWIPWGTLIANLLATVLSACMEGLSNRYFSGDNPTFTNQWVNAMLFALRTGVAGSLSTVSTMVKESVLLSEDHPGHARGHYYSMLTCISACLLGLAAYATTIRIN